MAMIIHNDQLKINAVSDTCIIEFGIVLQISIYVIAMNTSRITVFGLILTANVYT